MENVFLLGNFIEEVLVRMQDRDAQEIEEITAALLDENPAWDCLELTVPLNGQVEEEIFNALVSSEKITSLGITPVVGNWLHRRYAWQSHPRIAKPSSSRHCSFPLGNTSRKDPAHASSNSHFESDRAILGKLC